MSAPFNPHAFPSHGSMGEVVQEGMSLRDYFAAKAMHALIAAEHNAEAIADLMEASGMEPETLTALGAYKYADAMLKAREA